MKIKRKLFISSIFAFSLFLFSTSANAQHRVKHPIAKQKMVQNHNAKKHQNGEVMHAINVLKRTNKVIIVANNHVKKNKVYTGDLAKAVQHQRFAKKMLKMHKAHRAMQHSRVARNYAFRAIRNNKGTIDKEMVFNEQENANMGANISDADLDKELKDSDSNMSFKDEKISDKEMTELEVLEMDEAAYKNE